LFTLLLVLVGTWLLHSDTVREQIPWLTSAQLQLDGALLRLNPRPAAVRYVAPVEIDDAARWNPPLSGREPTNRRYLADLVRKAAESGAAVIGIDFRLTSPNADGRPGDDPAYAEEDEYLLETLNQVSAKTPVVITTFLAAVQARDGASRWRRLPNIYADESLPRVRVGHLNMPRDARQVPLDMPSFDIDRQIPGRVPSLAEQVVSAYEEVTNLQVRIQNQPLIREGNESYEFVFGGFIPRAGFRGNTILSTSLLGNDPDAVRRCQHRIVLIGGTWHEFGSGAGPVVDTFPSPAGDLPGLYMHSNYIESLLDDRYHREVPLWVGLLFDIVLGVGIYFSYGTNRRGWILVLFAAPLLFGYVFLANFGWYFDAMLPLTLCFVHLGMEHYEHRSKRNEKKKKEGKRNESAANEAPEGAR
jgi:CHASE2 domain-containing sensor protein